MDQTTTNPRRSGRRRWRAPLAALAVGLVSATGAAPLIGSGSAGAIPICTDPAGCPTGGGSGSAAVVPFPWDANVSLLDQSSGGVNRVLDGQWLGLGIFNVVADGGTVLWTNPEKTEGTLHTNSAPAGPLTQVGFRMLEPGVPGRLCRLPKQSSMPPSNRTLRILAAPPSGKSASELSMLAAGFQGEVDIDDAQVTISSTQLDSRSDGLFLTVQGHVWQDNQFPIPNVDADFTYKVLLHPGPSTSQLSMGSVVSVVADQGDLSLTGGNILDKFLLLFASDKEPKFRSTVAAKATDAFNEAIAADPNVSWFTSLGYTLTARRVTTSTAGIAIDGAFCRLGS